MTDVAARDRNWRTSHLDVLIGARIQTLRSERGISRADLARALGVSQPALQHIEAGENRVSASQLWQICGVLGIDANPIFQGLPTHVWRDRAEREAWSQTVSTPQRHSDPEPAEATPVTTGPVVRDLLRLSKAAQGLNEDQIDLLISVARGMNR